jgi:hypothetical protein
MSKKYLVMDRRWGSTPRLTDRQLQCDFDFDLRNTYGVLTEKTKAREQYLGVNGRIILKWMAKERGRTRLVRVDIQWQSLPKASVQSFIKLRNTFGPSTIPSASHRPSSMESLCSSLLPAVMNLSAEYFRKWVNEDMIQCTLCVTVGSINNKRWPTTNVGL